MKRKRFIYFSVLHYYYYYYYYYCYYFCYYFCYYYYLIIIINIIIIKTIIIIIITIMINVMLTSAVLHDEVWKPPQVAHTHRIPDHGQDELQLARPHTPGVVSLVSRTCLTVRSWGINLHCLGWHVISILMCCWLLEIFGD